ncbi:antibiotic biosynthesis monooxygenase [Methylocella sp. CPCC 101449]|uniref:antibiotic biosynthesis monooxygenase family protein n=1 Tax=Methylocella sp. CPCC 101449 TaxID=2987531 RepID=UPI00288FEAE2|nr:antibiotic biosynthesis monooxygenase [Methylocella sp. CPCC 101449]MDT2022178.1 antibiotic biosynthesis monooxygenase [Methylocella sp. CPCC 101449]
MFVAMNRFRVIPERANDFEATWLKRESYLHEMEGFMTFQLLRGAEKPDHVLFSSYTLWRTRQHFDAWVQSAQFAASHKRAGNSQPTIIGHPEFEGFDVIQQLEAHAKQPESVR